MHLQGSGSNAEDWQRLGDEGSVFTILSYNQNTLSTEASDTTYGVNIIKNTDRSRHGNFVVNYGLKSTVQVFDDSVDESYAIYGSIPYNASALDSGSYAGYFSGKTRVNGTLLVDGRTSETDLAIFDASQHADEQTTRVQIKSTSGNEDAQLYINNAGVDGWILGNHPSGPIIEDGFHIKSGSGDFARDDALILNNLGMSIRHNPTDLATLTGVGDIVYFGKESALSTLDAGRVYYLNASGL